MTISLGVLYRKENKSYWLWVNEKTMRVVWDFSNHAFGAYFKPYKEWFSLQISVHVEIDILERSFI
jgi:alpha-glucosidase (family GH31 glycosyl hydrolase)